MDKIRGVFEQSIGQKIIQEEWDYFASLLRKVELPKNHIITKCGQVENYLSFVETGILRYYIPKLENDLTFTFAFNNSFVSAYDSFLTRKESSYQIESLSHVLLWQISFDQLECVYRNTKIGQLIGRKASEDLYLKKTKRELSLLNQTAEERYLQLLDEEPHFIQSIPLKYIASYIGITPQALSRIRKRIS
jgi:CRP-like cAMP-binding protein